MHKYCPDAGVANRGSLPRRDCRRGDDEEKRIKREGTKGIDTRANRITVFRLACFEPALPGGSARVTREGVDWFSSGVCGVSLKPLGWSRATEGTWPSSFPSPFSSVFFTHAHVCA